MIWSQNVYVWLKCSFLSSVSAADDRASVSSGAADHESSHDSSSVDPEGDDLRLQAMESDESFW